MNKQVLLTLDQDGIYVGDCELDRSFFFDLKEAGFIQRASSFEDLPEKISAQFSVEDEELIQDKIVVNIFTNNPVPEKWGRTAKYLNRDLIGTWDGKDVIECNFQLDLEYVSIVEKGVSITIDIPL
ncbi:TPA: hypothetical protein DIC40_02140 [Patescibacteria group bacterium]|nr:hypothetical protein P148_SR1C00001G0259 [candidate division SR1 bacterium RAAC1_SR1_1]HCY20654.1 hypothetical protein [Candidatus Gracilibacteria bacterium]